MKTMFFCMMAAACVAMAFTKRFTGDMIVRMMHTRYAGKWHHALTFKQTTQRYRNDSLLSTQSWREAMLYPDKLRIDIEPMTNKNTIIFRADSTYRFAGGLLKAAQRQENDLVFLLGGMYAMPVDKALSKFANLGYDLNRAHTDLWQGKPVYVIGANNADEKVNQLWVDQANLYPVRMLEYNKSGKEEAIFDDHLKLGNAWTETKVHFYINDKLLQVESYYDCKALDFLDAHIFDVTHYTALN